MHHLFTIGYEGHTTDTFLVTLQDAGVSYVVDVRMLPLSRRRGFSKTPLRTLLNDAGIGYVHLRELGTPKPIRDAVKHDGDYAMFFDTMDALVREQHDALNAVQSLLAQHSTALLCVEADPCTCHRMSVVRALMARVTDLAVTHL